MAKFQLGHETYYLLKLMQAGVLAAETIHVERRRKNLIVSYHGWDHEKMNLEQLSQSFCSLFDVAPENAAGCLAVGLNAALNVSAKNSVSISLFGRGEGQGRTLVLGEELEWEDCQRGFASDSLLRITILEPKHSPAQTLETIQERCRFAPVAITVEETYINEPALPETAEAHLGTYFERNTILGEYRYAGLNFPLEEQMGTLVHKNFSDGRAKWLGLGVDVDPVSNLGLLKHGVITDFKKVNLGLPGLVGVVEASDLKTDLTALQVAESEELEELYAEVKRNGRGLVKDTVAGLDHVESERQATSASAPMSDVSAFISKGGIGSSLVAPFILADTIGQGVLIGFAILLSTPVVALVSGFITGYGKDKESDEAARRVLRSLWNDALRAS